MEGIRGAVLETGSEWKILLVIDNLIDQKYEKKLPECFSKNT